MKFTRHFFTALSAAAIAMAATLAPVTASAQEAKAEPVKATTAKATPVTKAKAVVGDPAVRPLSVTVDLVSKTQITGTLTDTTMLQMKSSFGAVDIPLSEVAGIRFASADDPSTTVVMLNGDSITGATDVKMITVETEWGTATINGVSVASILFVPGLSWSAQSGLNGSRWNLAEKKEAAPKANGRATNSPSNSGLSAPIPSSRTINGRPVQSFPSGSFQRFPNN
ncbi:MAG: hypothetical protein AAF989_02165 [Planctomycetota bacterium]